MKRMSGYVCTLMAGVLGVIGAESQGQLLGVAKKPIRMINTKSRQAAGSDWPQYTSNPFTFPVPEPVSHDQMFVVDVNGDGLMDFTYRSKTKLYVFDHFGAFLWSVEIDNPRTDIVLGNNRGTGHGAADVDGDGVVEIVALNRSNMMFIFDGSTGAVEDTLSLPIIGSKNKWVYIAVANLRGNGDRDVLLQTMDTSGEKANSKVNRNLLAWDLENNLELWRVLQDDDHSNGTYEGYWGVGHGSFQCADVDEDGRDEVIGANMVDDDGRLVDLGYPTEWVRFRNTGSTDHFDALSIGDFRPDIPGLEWFLTEEEDLGKDNYHTTLMSTSGIIWRKMTTLFTGNEREPQNIAAGNFDLRRQYDEVFVRSRFSGPDASQHPWLFDAFGEEFADYAMENVLPAGFSAHEYGNKEGLEQMATIDWFGGSKDYIAAKARHVNGNIGIFDAITGAAIWHSMESLPATRASVIYVADISGDGREEIITNDANGMIAVYWNEAPNTNPPRARKWENPLYRRTKQNWNYYSPGGYIQTNSGSAALTMISPNHGELWQAGTIQEIAWSASSDIANVSLQFSTDAGQSWMTIIDSTENNGAYSWTVQEANSPHCLLRVVDVVDDSRWDASDAVFGIVPPPPVPVIYSFTPGNGAHGTEVTISGEHFAEAVGVNFNGAASTAFQIMSSTEILATVPTGATTGKISVTTPDTTASSAAEFFVFDRQDVTAIFRAASGSLNSESNMNAVISSIPLPQSFTLYQNFPNPFNPETRIEYDLPEAVKVRLNIYNLLGHTVRAVVDQETLAGHHIVLWDGRDAGGQRVSAGVYFYQLFAGEFVATRKMLFLP